MKVLVYDLTMTNAPEELLAPRRLLLEHLRIDGAALGIVGDSAHRGGYHCGSDRVVDGDYSVTESERDRNGLTLDACALDVGMFTVTTARGAFDLRHFSRWIAGQCASAAPDTKDIREVIYSPDGSVVRRWDRLNRRSSGDSSHLWHTHISIHRDAIKAGRDPLSALFTRYLTYIGAIPTEVNFMSDQATFTRYLLGALSGDDADSVAVQKILRALPHQYPVKPGVSALNALFYDALPKLLAAVDADATRDAELRELIQAHASGQLSADAVVDALAKRLQVTPGA